MTKNSRRTLLILFIGLVILALILVFGNIWIGTNATHDTKEAAEAVSLMYLDELAGRRKEVVENNLRDNINLIGVAIDLMTDDDLRDIEHLQAYQARMKALFNLERFAFVDEDGLVYTSLGTQQDIDKYNFDYKKITGPEISVRDVTLKNKKAVIAVPTDLTLEGKKLVACFMEKDMDILLEGISLMSQEDGMTFCNIYTSSGVALTNTVLGGLAKEDNLLEAIHNAHPENGYSIEKMEADFKDSQRGVITFTYDGTLETLAYVPIEGTDWFLTYLVRDSVIGEQISSVSSNMIKRSIVQSIITAAFLIGLFSLIITLSRRSARATLEKETLEAANRVKQEEYEQKLALQEEIAEKNEALSVALEAAEDASKAKTIFLSNMSHEIRTPMNAIVGLNNIALNDPETPEKTKDYLEKMGASANHLLGLINDILDMSRIESGRMTIKSEEFSFPKMIENISTIIGGQCREKGLDYECRVEGNTDDYYIGDETKIRQVIINILGNAVKFTPEGGKVTFNVERTATLSGYQTLQFKIKDTGIGMSEEYLPKLFDTFSQEDSSATNRYGSTGLGMAITKNLVELMNGTIGVESEKGKGTEFTVSIPLGESDRGGAFDDDGFEIHPGDMTVLVIDDDPIAREHAQLVLGQVGIHCETAGSGPEAIEMVKLRQTRMEPYNLIIVDWKMPEMDGLETTREIRKIVDHDTAIIILTSYNWDEIADEAREAGVDTFVAKPLFAASVMDEFKAAFKSRKALGTKEVDLSGKRLLLAEDVDINAEIMVMVLSMRDIKVDRVENGRLAVEAFESSEPGHYDGILMDMRMPEMDGLEATRVIRALDREDAKAIPIIALTANAFDEDVQRSMQAGLNAHLSKPVQPEDLFATLEQFLK